MTDKIEGQIDIQDNCEDEGKRKLDRIKPPTKRQKNEAAFVRSLPDEGIVEYDGFRIDCGSDSDADHVDVIRDMRAMGYFDDEW